VLRKVCVNRLYIDVKLGPQRTVNIAVTDGDDPQSIAEQFCRIYALDMAACGVLAQVVRDNMESNGVLIGTDGSGLAGAFRNVSVSDRSEIGGSATGTDSFGRDGFDSYGGYASGYRDSSPTSFLDTGGNSFPATSAGQGAFEGGESDRDIGANMESSITGASNFPTQNIVTTSGGGKALRRKTVFRKSGGEDRDGSYDAEGPESARLSQDDSQDSPSLADTTGSFS
jgi:hypothetical protein